MTVPVDATAPGGHDAASRPAGSGPIGTAAEGSTDLDPVAPGPVAPVPDLVRRRSGRMLAGAAGGVADHLGIRVLWVRATFVVLTVTGGAGVLAYGLLWVFVRQDSADRARPVSRVERQQALGLAALGIGVGLAATALGNGLTGWIVGPLGVAAAGAALVWREADEAQRRRWAAGARSGVVAGGRTAALRVLAGALFVAAGIAVFLLGNVDLGQVQFGVLAVLATLVGVAVLTVPWWVRLVRDLSEERRARIVSAERADIAAHLHDSVLQTLALIQRQAEQPREVLRLARGQERELRTWLYGPGGYGPGGYGPGGYGSARDPGHDAGLAEAVTAAAAEVADSYAVDVRPVVVGDTPLDGALRALVLAAREAMVNAAKHAGVTEFSVYCEVEGVAGDEPGQVHLFVRDRGVGFDPDAVGDDRHGLADSIRGRMARHGGAVELRTRVGDGTEVHLSMPLAGSGEPVDRPGQEKVDHEGASL